jgi:hypothetical protein
MRESAGFGLADASEPVPGASASCYHLICKGPPDARALHIRLEGRGVELPCPSGAYIALDKEFPGVLLSLKILLLFPSGIPDSTVVRSAVILIKTTTLSPLSCR